VVYDHYGGKARFPRVSDAMMDAVDKADAPASACDDVLNPRGWELLSFLMDARTGLGRFRDFRVSNYQLMMMLIDCCRDHGIDEILALPDVKERVDLFFASTPSSGTDRPRGRGARQPGGAGPAQRADHLRRQPLRGVRHVPAVRHQHARDVGPREANTVYTVGKSIFDRGNPLTWAS
jgi:hypothetical protein